MLRHRIQTGLLLGGAFLAGVFFLPPLATLVILLLLGGLALLEFYSFLDARGIPHFKLVGLFCGLAMMAGTWLSYHYNSPWKYDVEADLLYATMAAIFLRQIFRKNDEKPWMTMAGTLLGFLYVAFLFNFLTKLLTVWGDANGRFLMLYLVLVVKCTDIGAFFTGCAIGKHKLIPHVSPNKTWEGCIGGVILGVATGYIIYFLRHKAAAVAMTPLDVLISSVLLAVAGIIGDLIESLLKRASGLKDSGTMFLGMGGILDVLDSLLFAAPVLYVYARLFIL